MVRWNLKTPKNIGELTNAQLFVLNEAYHKRNIDPMAFDWIKERQDIKGIIKSGLLVKVAVNGHGI